GFEPALEDAIRVLGTLGGSLREVEVTHCAAAGWAVGMLLLPHSVDLLADALAAHPDLFQPETLDLLRVGHEIAAATEPCGRDHSGFITWSRSALSTRAATNVAGLPWPVRRVVRRHLFNRRQGEIARRLVMRAWDEVFRAVDVVVTPTIPAPPPLIAENRLRLPSGTMSPDKAYLPLTGPMNLAGVPCISVPCGTAAGGWPVSLSLTAARGNDEAVLSLAEAFEDRIGVDPAARIAPGFD
ncbi:MAG: amidase family protein, partial [Actinomycetota bacterium]|nr:amidase family protein [Actinomycetota bacterium]